MSRSIPVLIHPCGWYVLYPCAVYLFTSRYSNPRGWPQSCSSISLDPWLCYTLTPQLLDRMFWLAFQKTRVSLINTFYEITPLAVVCPYVIAECSAFKSFAKGQQPYLLVRISAKKADEIAVKPERRGSFEWVFVLCSCTIIRCNVD